jgi:hypothetical protein
MPDELRLRLSRVLRRIPLRALATRNHITRSLGPFVALSVIAGCATQGSFPTYQSSAWGFHSSLTNVPSAEVISWAPSLTACEVFRANDISVDERLVREGKVTLPMIFDGTCQFGECGGRRDVVGLYRGGNGGIWAICQQQGYLRTHSKDRRQTGIGVLASNREMRSTKRPEC